MGGVTSSSPETSTTQGVRGTSVEEDLGWALGVVFRRYAKQSGQALEDVPGGPRGYQVLATAQAEGPKRQLDLAAQLEIDRTVMTYLLDDLEKEGLVQRQPDPADRRARLIVATPKGVELLCDLERRLRATEDEVMGGLDDGERLVFRMLLQRVARQANAIDPVHNACTLVEQGELEITES
ncbi:MarR family winged helix-turn-helix transcriptional regulator [Kribbella lupini]|uniref:HTH marR-type domain-containing protein n=1 Tax=Kribbella lupini TaxID=291602 RepID=A0ABN2A9M8_9ACTN